MYGYTTWTLTKCIEKKLDADCTRVLQAILNNSRSNILWNNSCTATYLLSLNSSKKDRQCMRDTTGEATMKSSVKFSCGTSHIDMPVLDNQEHTNKFCMDTGCCLEDLLGVMDDRDVWQERVREIHASCMTWWWWYIYVYIYIYIYSHRVSLLNEYSSTSLDG